MCLKRIIFLLVLQTAATNGIKVRVEQGVLEGKLEKLVTGDGYYKSFKGIPYAEPPIGKLRFKAPRPARPWQGVWNATQHGSVCSQVDIFTGKYVSGSSENCLFINLYIPNFKPRKPFAVTVFIHGGGYKSGSGNDNNYGPDFFILQNMILVTFNYRLDALGFLCLRTKPVPGNAGLKDQVLALKWVKANIKCFGGDPNRVTIMGQSAGGASVGLHIISPMSQGLFKRAISLSGSPFCDWSLPFQPDRRAYVLAKQLGFETEDPDKLLEFLQSVPADKLVNTRPNVLSFEESASKVIIKMFPFGPVIEKHFDKSNFLTHNIFKDFAHINKVDILFGHTDQEILLVIESIRSFIIENYNMYPELFVPRKILNLCKPNTILYLSDIIRQHYFGNTNSVNINATREFVNYLNDATFTYDILRYFSKLPIIEGTVRYFYQFSSKSSRNVYGLQGEKYGISGASHLDDLMYLFDPKLLNLTLNRDSLEFKLIDQVTTLFSNFAKYGNPTHGTSLRWPLFNNKTMHYMNIGNSLSVSSAKCNKNIKFWDRLYDFIGFKPYFDIYNDLI